MFHEMKLGYLVFEARAPEAWRTFCMTMLGLPAPHSNDDGSYGYRLDGAAHRIVVTPGRSDDLAGFGLELPDHEALAALQARLTQAGVEIEVADEGLCRIRRVRSAIRFRDPAGSVVEAYVGMAEAEESFASESFPAGFQTELGIGHVALLHHDVDAMERFYVDVLGHAVTERMESRVGPIDFRGVFLHCNRRHHSIAILDLPLEKRIHHFMLDVADHAGVGRAFERAEQLGVPVNLGLGQHSDETFSFYGSTPSGFDFEIGAGGEQIDPASWRERPTRADRWGHHPTMRLKLKTFAAIVRYALSPKRRPDTARAASDASAPSHCSGMPSASRKIHVVSE